MNTQTVPTSLLNILTPDSVTQGAGGSLRIIDLPSYEYHADREAISCSMLKSLLVSPAHFQAALLAPPKTSDALDFGSLLHLLLLEPHAVGAEVAVYPGIGTLRDKEYKAFVEANLGRLIVDEPTFSRAKRLCARVLETRFRGRPLGLYLEESVTEVSYYYTDVTTGQRIRTRLDIEHPDFTFDLKSTRHSNPKLFLRDIVDMHYDLQAYMYSLARVAYGGDVACSKPFVFIAAEVNEPLSVSCFTAGETVLSNGGSKYIECMAALKACAAVDYWPDLSCEMTAEIDHWQTFNGKDASWKASLAKA